MLPNFFVAGCQKCATTTIHYAFTQHPDICLPQKKESKFFVVDKWYSLGIDHYAHRFDLRKKETAIGEVDPDYIYFENALTRIKKHFDIKKIKFIFIFRNPTERAFSHYLMTYRRGLESKPFAEALSLEQNRITEDFDSRMHFSYVDRGFYYKQLVPFLKILHPKQMLFLLTEDFKHDRKTVLETCFNFLGVDSNFTDMTMNTNHHKATIPRSHFLINELVRKQDTLPKKLARLIIPNKTLRHKIREKILDANQTTATHRITLQKAEQRHLIEIYRSENLKLATLMNRDLSHWNQLV